VIRWLAFEDRMFAPPSPAARVLRFAAFELNLHTGELRKRGVPLRLNGQPIHVLTTLLESAGHLVTREEFRARLWSADTFVNFDHSLHNAIARIRGALGDSVESPRFIETLPRRGYRFIAPVEVVQAAAVVEASGPRSEPPKLRLLVMLALASCAIAAAGFAAWRPSRR
jgi:DNA-binding winged helix-turn-helix (wHTH) protein